LGKIHPKLKVALVAIAYGYQVKIEKAAPFLRGTPIPLGSVKNGVYSSRHDAF